MHRYEAEVLKVLLTEKNASIEAIMEKSGLDKAEVLWAIENLQEQLAIEVKRRNKYTIELSSEGKEYAKTELPEIKLLKEAQKRLMSVSELKDERSRIGFQWAKSKKLIDMENGVIKITSIGKDAISKGTKEDFLLKALSKDPNSYEAYEKTYFEELENLQKRKLLSVQKKSEIENVTITPKGVEYLKSGVNLDEIDQLSKKILVNRGWHGKKFKKYDVNTKVDPQIPGVRHPLRQTIQKIRQTYLSMGFSEMSGPTVVPAFWTFDSLFVPQDHPARDAQDTFYLSHPDSIALNDPELVKKVGNVHKKSWYSSWSEKVASQAVLRTQMTSASVMQIYDLKKYANYSLPIKLFTVGRIFRNENLDYKHLADFYQTDGIVIGEDLTMSNLFDILIKLYKSMGIKIRFKPSYFPFVEPGAEAQGWYESKKQWVELGGCGIIRREITGIARKNATVLAWGLGVERMLLFNDEGIKSITELYNNGIGWIRKRV